MKIAYVGNFADAMPGKTFIKVGALECHKKVKLTKQIFAENASEGTLKCACLSEMRQQDTDADHPCTFGQTSSGAFEQQVPAI